MTKQEALDRLNKQLSLRIASADQIYLEICAIEHEASDTKLLVMQSSLMENRAAVNALEYAIWVVESIDGG